MRSKAPINSDERSSHPFLERHYRPAELAKLWGFGVDLVRTWFEDEPDVLIEKHPETLHKRGYRSLRIPESVAHRVYQVHLNRKPVGRLSIKDRRLAA
jgi:hypothetical protein